MYPELFSITLFGRELTIYSFGFFVLVAFIVGIWVLFRQLKMRGLSREKIIDNILWIIIGGIIGGRLVFVLSHLRFFYSGNWLEVFKIWYGGFDFHGVFLGGLLITVAWLWVEKRKELWAWLDSAMVALVISHSIGMIGSFLLGSSIGRSSCGPLAVVFPSLQDNIARHPTQLYEMFFYFIVFIILILLPKVKGGIFPGFVFFAGLILHFLVRFIIEFYREPDIVIFREPIEFSLSHLMSLILIVAGIVGLLWLERKSV